VGRAKNRLFGGKLPATGFVKLLNRLFGGKLIKKCADFFPLNHLFGGINMEIISKVYSNILCQSCQRNHSLVKKFYQLPSKNMDWYMDDKVTAKLFEKLTAYALFFITVSL